MEGNSISDTILSFYSKDKYGKDIYSTKNPVSVYEILSRIFGAGAYDKYNKSVFCKSKHEALKSNCYGYSFHCLNRFEIQEFIEEVTKM